LLSLRYNCKQAVAPKAAAPKIHLDLPDGVPAYWAEACRQLMRRDRVLKRLIPQLGSQALLPCGQEQAFATLARSIGQQISAKSAKTLWNKFAKLPAAMQPEQVLRLKVDDMRARDCRRARWTIWSIWRCTSPSTACTWMNGLR
jgi:DNA-3-methyladenine glycosylase II